MLLKALPRVCTENTLREGLSRDKYSTRRSRVLYKVYLEIHPRLLYFCTNRPVIDYIYPYPCYST